MEYLCYQWADLVRRLFDKLLAILPERTNVIYSSLSTSFALQNYDNTNCFGSSLQRYILVSSVVNPFHATSLCLYPLKTENQKISGIKCSDVSLKVLKGKLVISKFT